MLDDGSGRSAPRVPRDAATLVVIDRSGREPRVLMGRRRADLAFLPGKFVFPGGRVDAVDRRPGGGGTLQAQVLQKLLVRMRGRPSERRASALARAAVRETAEETGLVFETGSASLLAHLSFIARAVTPPGRVRRYDTRFFMADADLVAGRTLSGDGELTDLGWYTLRDIRALDLPGITRLVVEDVAQFSRSQANPFASEVPYYYHRAGRFHRDLL